MPLSSTAFGGAPTYCPTVTPGAPTSAPVVLPGETRKPTSEGHGNQPGPPPPPYDEDPNPTHHPTAAKTPKPTSEGHGAAPGPPPPPPPASDDDGASAEVDDDVGVAPEVGSPPSAMPTFAKTKKPTSEGHGNYPGPPPPPPPDDDGAATAAADADPTAAPTRESKRMPGFVQGKKKAGHS